MSLTQINKAGLDEIALDHVFTIGAYGSSAYTFQGEGLNGTVNNPTLYLTRGKTYRFENGSGGHPIRIQSTSGASGTAYNTGVTNNAGSGTVIVEVQHDAPDVLYYQCTSHAAMNGILYITGALADGGVTTAKIANGAVSNAKIVDGAINNAKVVSDAAIAGTKISPDFGSQNITTTASLQGAGVNISATIPVINFTDTDGNPDYRMTVNSGVFTLKDQTNDANRMVIASNGTTTFASNVDFSSGIDVTGNITCTGTIPAAQLTGALPAIDGSNLTGISGTTINNNADNRILTGTGSANTIQGESQLLFDSNGLLYVRAPDGGNRYFFGETGNSQSAQLSLYNSSDQQKVRIVAGDGASEGATFFNGGKVGIGTSSPASKLHLYESTSGNNYIHFSNSSTGISTSDGGQVGIDGNEGLIVWQSENNYLRFATNNTERMRILAGGGLTFNGDTAAANALDDYEEGTWTPNPHGYWSGAWRQASYSGSIEGATYTKIGRLVYFKCYFSNVTVTANAQGTYARIDGLPYTAANDSYGSNTTAAHSNAFDNTNTGSFYITPNNNYMIGTRFGSGSYDYATWKSSNFYMMLAGTYQAA